MGTGEPLGKVNIIVTSDTMTTDQLYALMKDEMPGEDDLKVNAKGVTGGNEDIKVYIVPGDN